MRTSFYARPRQHSHPPTTLTFTPSNTLILPHHHHHTCLHTLPTPQLFSDDVPATRENVRTCCVYSAVAPRLSKAQEKVFSNDYPELSRFIRQPDGGGIYYGETQKEVRPPIYISHPLPLFCLLVHTSPIHTGSIHIGPIHTVPIHTGPIHTAPFPLALCRRWCCPTPTPSLLL